MKKIYLLLLLIPFFINCSSGSSEQIEIEQIIIPPKMEEITSLLGNFVSDAHTTTGATSVNEEKTKLFFNNFKTDNGPKLLVYLATEVGSSDFKNLGDLKGISGDFEYIIPSNTDLNKYKYVVIWCVDFSVSFGHAILN